MEIKDILLTIATISGLFGGLVGGWATIRGIKPKNLLDDSSAAENFQKIVIELQAEMVDLRTQQTQDRFMLTEYIRGTKILIAQLQRLRVTPDWIPPLDYDENTRPRKKGGFDLRL